jgi:predicted NBD/HSP70 family sugar kinase
LVETDLKLAAYAEHHLGDIAGNLIYLHLGRRIAVALMVDDQILQGRNRMAGELGAQRGMRWTPSYDDGGGLCWSTGREARPLIDRAAAGDHRALAEIHAFSEQLAPRLATLALTLDPELVIVGGGLSRAGRTLLGPLARQLDRLLDLPVRPELTTSRLTSDASVTGALAYAFERGSEQIFGLPAVPPPWRRLRTAPETDPRTQADRAGTQ